MDIGFAYEVAAQIVEAQRNEEYSKLHPDKPFKQPPEKLPPAQAGLGGRPILVHREKTFIYNNWNPVNGEATGEVITLKCCAATGCEWGRTRKNHSDGVLSGTVYSAEVMDVEPEEVSEDTEQEIIIPAFGVGFRDGELEPEPEEQESVEQDEDGDEYDDEE